MLIWDSSKGMAIGQSKLGSAVVRANVKQSNEHNTTRLARGM